MPSSLEDRVGALEEKVANLEENLRRHIATSCETYEELARTLLEARNEDCELPPGCETVLTITEEEESAE